MQTSTIFQTTAKPFQASTKATRINRRVAQVSCSALPEQTRRGLLAGIAGIAAVPLIAAGPAEAKLVERVIPGESLSSFQRKDLLKDLQNRAEKEIKAVVTIADAPAALRLVFNDAATYDAKTKTGGVNGSVVLSEELNRLENKDLKNLVDRLSKARDAVIAASPKGQRPISWADTLVLAVKVTQQALWRADLVSKNPVNGEFIADAYSNRITVRLGRLDADRPDPSPGGIPAPGASAQEVLSFMNGLAVSDPKKYEGFGASKLPFWERVTFMLWPATQPDQAACEAALVAQAPEAFAAWKDKYDKSRKLTIRQDYEIDFITFFNKLADLGAKFEKYPYLYDVTVLVPDRL